VSTHGCIDGHAVIKSVCVVVVGNDKVSHEFLTTVITI
jgi:hypothetical protein